MQAETEVMLALWWLQIIRKVLVTWWTGWVLRIWAPRWTSMIVNGHWTWKHHLNVFLCMTYAQLPTVEMKVECQFELWKFTRKTSYDMTWLHKEAVTTLKQVKHMCVSESDVCPSLEEKANITAHCNGCEPSAPTATVFPCFCFSPLIGWTTSDSQLP